MPLLLRIVATLTLVFSLGLMAVSAYASEQGARIDLRGDVLGTMTQVLPGGGTSGPQSDLAPANEATPRTGPGAEPTASPEPTPTANFELRYAAPDNAAPVTGARNARGDLSGPRVWNVPSLKPSASLDSLTYAVRDIPLDQLAVMQQVSLQTGVPWQVLAAIAKIESDFGRNMATSWAGAIGYGQFLPEMWEIFGAGGNPYDFRDAIPAMARYLLVAGAPADMAGAIYSYNHLWSYVADVLAIAADYGYPENRHASLAWPAVGALTTFFGPQHQGIDIDQSSNVGGPVRAAHDGIVYFAGGDPCCSYGKYVILSSPTGISTLYAHFEDIFVRTGETVFRGQALGSAGCTGHCTGPHVHFEVRDQGIAVDPLGYLP